MRRLICIFLLLCLPLQSFAMQGGLLTLVSESGSLAHELEHDEGIQHHHEDDGAVHYDDSDESIQHVQDASSAQMAFLTAQLQPVAPVLSASAVDCGLTHFIPDPFLDDPQRPPAPSLG